MERKITGQPDSDGQTSNNAQTQPGSIAQPESIRGYGLGLTTDLLYGVDIYQRPAPRNVPPEGLGIMTDLNAISE